MRSSGRGEVKMIGACSPSAGGRQRAGSKPGRYGLKQWSTNSTASPGWNSAQNAEISTSKPLRTSNLPTDRNRNGRPVAAVEGSGRNSSTFTPSGTTRTLLASRPFSIRMSRPQLDGVQISSIRRRHSILPAGNTVVSQTTYPIRKLPRTRGILSIGPSPMPTPPPEYKAPLALQHLPLGRSERLLAERRVPGDKAHVFHLAQRLGKSPGVPCPTGSAEKEAIERDHEPSRWVVLDFKARHPPALDADIVGHDAQALGLDFSRPVVVPPDARIRKAVGKARENQAIAMHVGTHQQHGSTMLSERDQLAFRIPRSSR